MFFKPDPRLLALIRDAGTVALVTHIYPDGDSLGSEVGLADALLGMGKRVHVWNCHPPPAQLQFVDGKGYVEIVPRERIPDLPSVDLILSVDTAELTRLGYLASYFTGSRARKAACDHHILPERHPFEVAWAEEKAGATGVLVLDLLEALGVAPSPLAAAALFVAIASDTGWFSFSNTSARELAAASILVDRGACPAELHRKIAGNATLERTALLGEMLAGAHAEFDGKFVWSCIQNEQMEARGIRYEELDGMIDELKRIEKAGIVALIIGLRSSHWKVSLRGPAGFDVDAIARHFGGGGHAKAAGYRVGPSSFEEVLRDLTAEVAAVLAAGDSR